MPIFGNVNAASRLAVPGGYPCALSPLGQSSIEGVIPPRVASVTATLAADSTAAAHLAIYRLAATVGGADGEEVARTNLSGISSAPQDITVEVPATELVPAAYVVRLWFDGAPGVDGVSVSDMVLA